MTACCGRRRNDGTVDRTEIDRAVDGRFATLSPDELRVVCMRLARENKWGLTRISQHTGAPRSTVGKLLKELREVRP